MDINNISTFCIFPHDRTTMFLDRIAHTLKREIGEQFHCFKVKLNDESHNKCLNTVTLLNNSTVLFLGHGRSDKLYGACGDDSENTCYISQDAVHEGGIQYYKREDFITTANANIFCGNAVIAFSCNSNRNRPRTISRTSIINGATCFIGFGYILTDYDDEFDSNLRMTKREIGIFKGVLVSIMKQALVCAYREKLDAMMFVEVLKVLTNKEIHRITMNCGYLRRTSLIISKHLYKFQDEVCIFGNKFVCIFP